jgi:EAL domain-containing protein (putative c-di-GMP-specific phosphodiesterase class I)
MTVPADPPRPRVFRDPSQVRTDLAADLSGAAGRGELLAYFQPLVDVATGRIVAAEALCRWRHPGIGLVSPNVFIEIAERTEVIEEIGRFMLETGCAFLQHAERNGLDLAVSVNASPAQLSTDGVWTQLRSELAARSLDPTRVTVEVTESLKIEDPEGVAAVLTVLKDHGVGVSLDDFGTGHTSAAQFSQLPITEVKIDRSLIQATAAGIMARVEDAIWMANRLKIRVVAEGVETPEQMDYVRRLGCERAQGFLLGRAMPLASFDAFVARQRAELAD